MILFLGWLFTTAVSTQAQTPPVLSLEEYWAVIEEVQTEISTLREEDPALQPAGLTALAAELEQITAVQLPDGRVIPVNPSHLANSLRREEPDFNQINNHLAALLLAKQLWPDNQLTDLDEATLTQILSQPEFQYDDAEPNAVQRFFQEARRRFF